MKDWKRLNNKTTKEIITLFQEGESPDKDDAFFVLVNRFKRDLLNFCEIRCKSFGQGPNVAECIVEKTFQAYATKGKFLFENGKGKNDDHSFLIYLNGIAKNKLTDFYRDQQKKEQGLHYDGSECIVTSLPALPDNAPMEAKVKYKVLKSLPYSHLVIYLTYKSYEKDGCNLPKKLLTELKNHLGGITQVTVRTYKKEAIDKINEALSVLSFTKSKNV